MNWLDELERKLVGFIPPAVVAFTTLDGVSSFLHGLAVLVPGLFLFLIWPIGALVWAFLSFGFYCQREVRDYIRFKKAGNRAKMADSVRDLFFPFISWVILVGMVLF